MSSNVGLTTPRGSGTSGYVQRNYAFMKPRNQGYGAPYPPVSGANSGDFDRGFKQRQPDKQILEHDRRRAIEVKVMEERERLEEENERIEEEEEEEEEEEKSGGGGKGKKEDKEEGEEREGPRILSEEEIDERCEVLRAKLVKEMEEEDEIRKKGGGSGRGEQRGAGGRGMAPPPPRERRQFKSYQVHELAEAKIEESERLRRALGIKEDRETGELSSGRGPLRRDQDRERGRERS